MFVVKFTFLRMVKNLCQQLPYFHQCLCWIHHILHFYGLLYEHRQCKYTHKNCPYKKLNLKTKNNKYN